MTITFYQYTGRYNTVNKTLPTGTEIDGVFRGSVDIVRPVVTIRAATRPTYNYAYIADTGRYYFVNDITAISAETYSMRLTCDVLKTYAANIRAATGTLTNATAAQAYASNRASVHDTRPDLQTVAFSADTPFTLPTQNIMVTIKGQ